VIEKKHRTLSSIYLINDAVASNLAMLCAWFLRFSVKVIPVTKGQQEVETYLQLLPIVTLVFPLAFAVQGLYRIRPTRSKTEEWLSVAIGSVVATVVFSGVQFGGLAVCVGFFDRLFDCGLDRVENRLAKNGLRVIVAQLTASRVTL